MGALLVAAATFGLVVPATAQIQQTDRYAVTDFAVKVPNADVDLGVEARDKVRDSLSQVFGRNRETVPTDQVTRAMRDLGLMPPVTRAADLLRLGDAVDAQYVVTGEVANWRIVEVSGGRQAQVLMVVQVRNVSGGVPVNAAVATGKSAPRAGDTSDATLLADALTDGAFQVVNDMEGKILPKATVLNTTDSRILLNQGARSGMKEGMKVIFLRGAEQVAEGVVNSVDADSAWVRVTRQVKGVRPGDSTQTIVDVPVLAANPWGGDGAPKTRASRSSGGNQALFSLLLLLVILGFLFLGGRGSSNEVVGNVKAEATTPSVSPGVRVSWTLDAFARGNNEGPYRWQVWRQGVNTNPVAVALAPASFVVDDTLGTFAPASGSQWDDFGGISGGNSCINEAPPGGDDPVAAPLAIGVPQRYSVEMVYRVDPNSLPFPPNGSGGGGGTTGTTGTTGGTGTTGTTGGTGTTGTTGGTGTTGTTGGTGTTGNTGGGGAQYCYFVSVRVPASGQATPLNRPQLTAPTDGANDTGNTVFSFQSVRGLDPSVPLEYAVQLSPDPVFGGQSVTLGEFIDTATPNAQALATQPVATGTLFPTSTTVYWRIGVRNVQDVPGPVADSSGKRYIWSGARRITR